MLPELQLALPILLFSLRHPFHLIFFWLRLQLLLAIVQLQPSLLLLGPRLLSFQRQFYLTQLLQLQLLHLLLLIPYPGWPTSPRKVHLRH